jgi:hypothetical protein
MIVKKNEYLKRPSPSYHANDYKWKVMKGNDGYDYISRPDKRMIFHWKRITNGKTAEEYYKQFGDYKPVKYKIDNTEKLLKRVDGELNKHNIKIYYLRWKNTGLFMDNAWLELYKKTDFSKSFIFYTENQKYWAMRTGILSLQHNILNKDKNLINEIFKKHFGKKYKWPGTPGKAIVLNIK